MYTNAEYIKDKLTITLLRPSIGILHHNGNSGKGK